MTDNPMIAALLRERAGYLRVGRKERAAMVDEQLAVLGYQDPEKASDKAQPKGRQQPPKRTA